MAYKSQGQLTKASSYCNQALAVYQRAFGDDASGAVPLYNALSQLAIAQEKYDEATKYHQRADDIQAKNPLDREPVFATTLHHRALIAYQKVDYLTAEKLWLQALAIQ